MATEFPNIDFKFRRGTKEGYSNTSYLEGSLNFVKDDEALYVHKDGIRFRISDVVLDAGTEAQIRAIVLPKSKIYYAEDTHRLLWYDRPNLEWTYVRVYNCDEADRAVKDQFGNEINEFYYPRSEALADHEDIMSVINSITEDISLIVRFDTVICDSIADLPEFGAKGTIYLVPKLSYFGWDNLPSGGDDMDVYVELIFIESDVYGNFYEVVGSTVIKMDNYYTKDEVDSMIDTFQQEVNSTIQTFKNYMLSELNGLRSTVNTLNSTVNNELAAMSNRLTALTSSITAHEQAISGLDTRVTALEAVVDGGGGSGGGSSIGDRLSALETGLSDLSDTVDDNKTNADTAIGNISNSLGTVTGNVNTVIQRVTNTENDITSLDTRLDTAEDNISNHEERISTLEEGGGSISDLSTRVNNLESEYGTLSGVVDSINDQIISINDNISTMSTDIGDAKNAISIHSNRLDNLEAADTTINETLTNLDTSLHAIENTLGDTRSNYAISEQGFEDDEE